MNWSTSQFAGIKPMEMPEPKKDSRTYRPAGRPGQYDYRPWSDHEIAILCEHAGKYGGYRKASKILGRSIQSCKAKGAKL